MHADMFDRPTGQWVRYGLFADFQWSVLSKLSLEQLMVRPGFRQVFPFFRTRLSEIIRGI
jgi:hypothetical protein